MSFEFDFTAAKLGQIIPNAAYGVDTWFNELNEMLPVFEILLAEWLHLSHKPHTNQVVIVH